METKKLLNEVMERDLEDLKELEIGSKEREALVSEIKDFYKLQIEEYRSEVDAWDKDELRRISEEKNAAEERIAEAKTKTEFKKSAVDAGKAIVIGVGSAFLSNRMMKALLKFEETGTVTSKAFRLIPMIKFW